MPKTHGPESSGAPAAPENWRQFLERMSCNLDSFASRAHNYAFAKVLPQLFNLFKIMSWMDN